MNTGCVSLCLHLLWIDLNVFPDERMQDQVEAEVTTNSELDGSLG